MNILRKNKMIIFITIFLVVILILSLTTAFVDSKRGLMTGTATIEQEEIAFVSAIEDGADISNLKNVVTRDGFKSDTATTYNISATWHGSEKMRHAYGKYYFHEYINGEQVPYVPFTIIEGKQKSNGIVIELYCVTNLVDATNLPSIADIAFDYDDNDNLIINVTPIRYKFISNPYDLNGSNTWGDMDFQFYLVISGDSEFVYNTELIIAE